MIFEEEACKIRKRGNLVLGIQAILMGIVMKNHKPVSNFTALM
jgi:hypothetical protein